jgi:hypothetical protein
MAKKQSLEDRVKYLVQVEILRWAVPVASKGETIAVDKESTPSASALILHDHLKRTPLGHVDEWSTVLPGFVRYITQNGHVSHEASIAYRCGACSTIRIDEPVITTQINGKSAEINYSCGGCKQLMYQVKV